jgi:quinol monooxygenase YgiN
MDMAPSSTHALSGVIVILLLDYMTAHRAWGWLRLAQGPAALKGTPGLLFSKVMGSGYNGGFSLRPSGSHQGLLCAFSSQAEAEAFMDGPHIAACQERAKAHWLGLMSVTSVRGAWDQQAWTATPAAALKQPVASDGHFAALTRASIRPAKAMSFWRHAPASQASLDKAPGCLLAMGLGEAPLIRQCTFSVWRDTESMVDYAHQGAHQQAIQAAYKQDFFSESLFVRMRILRMHGHWQGRSFDQTQGAPHV